MRRARARPEILRTPPQGWSSLLLVSGLLGLVGISIADSRALLLGSGASVTSPMPVLMVAAGLIGFVLARSSLGVVRAHVVGAVVAATTLLLVAGGALLSISPMPSDVAGVGTRIGAVWQHLDADIVAFIADEAATPVVTTFLLLGAICWTTAQFSAFAVFRYDRGGPAVIAIGTVLFLNVGLDKLDGGREPLPVLPVLAAFSALSMLLLMRMQLVQQRLAWARRHIADGGEVSRLFLRSGVAFVLVAVVGASTLTTLASAEAVELDLGALEEPLQDMGDEVARFLGLVGLTLPADALGPRQGATRIASRWEPGRGTAFTARVTGHPGGNYWWGYADDHYDPEGRWSTTTDGEPRAAPAGFIGSFPAAGAGGDTEVDATITMGDAEPPSARAQLFRLPDAQELIGHDAEVTPMDDERSVNDIVYRPPLGVGDTVEVRSLMWDYRTGRASLTEAMLQEAGTEYPRWVLETYLQGRDDPAVVGPPDSRVRTLADRIFRRHDNPFDMAYDLQQELRGGRYVTDLGDRCGDRTVPECTLELREGFCQQYATTMAIVLRQMGIPARFVYGYLPGEQQPDEGVWRVEQAAYHNWVEVYFPDIGWVRFDPTPGTDFGRGGTELPPGERTRDEPDDPFLDPTPPEDRIEDEPSAEPSLAPIVPDDVGSGGSVGVGRIVTVVLSGAGLVVLALALASLVLLYRLRRLPDGDGGLAYRGIVSLATRLGHPPHPAQTEYEYTGTLAQALPTVRDDLYVVAHARVESAYGGRQLDRERRGRLRRAYARVRTALVRLSLRLRR